MNKQINISYYFFPAFPSTFTLNFNLEAKQLSLSHLDDWGIDMPQTLTVISHEVETKS